MNCKTSHLKECITLIIFFQITVHYYGQVSAKIFKDDCYSNTEQSLYNNSSYTKSQISIGNDNVSSVQMYSNRHFIRLYEHDNYLGEYRDVYYHMNDLNSIDFEDKTSSIKVYSSNTTLPSIEEEVVSARILNSSSIDYVKSQQFEIPKNLVDNNSRIHMQALGVNKNGNRIVLTGCVASGSISGCTGKSYIFLFDTTGTILDVYAPSRPTSPIYGESHPSSTQMIGNIFPVAIATEPGQTGPSIIRFYSIDNDTISVVNGSQSINVNDHIGTLAYANINGNTYLIGGNWNSEKLYIWQSFGQSMTSNYSLISNINVPINPLNRLTPEASIDENWSAYNSFWLGKMAEDGRVILFATHGQIARSWADVWEINNIQDYNNIRFNKIHKLWKDRSTTNRPYFLEGTYPKYKVDNPPLILAFPDDFNELTPSILYSNLYTLKYEQKYCANEPGPTKIKEQEAKFKVEVKIYPNPSLENIIYIETVGVNLGEQLLIEIFDMKGLKTLEIIETKKYNNNVIDVSKLENGLYLLKISNRKKRTIAMEKLIITK